MVISRENIKRMLENPEHISGKLFVVFIQFLIILSLITFSIDTLPDLSLEDKKRLNIIESITVILFTIEYIARIVVADHKLRFVFSFFGLVDLLAILPYYIVTGLDLRTVRIFRLLRLVRILKLLKYNKAIKRFQRALMIAKEELILSAAIALIMLYLSSVGIYYFENEAQPEQFKSIFHSLWWAITTLTTVGYGDMYPVTTGGKFFTFFVLIIGLGVVAVPTGLVASALTQARKEEK